MPVPDAITISQLSRLIGTPDCPSIIDVRTDDDVAADPRFLPTSIHRDYRTVASWAGDYVGRSVVVTCLRGGKLAQGAAAWLRHAGAHAEFIEGGFEGWVEAHGVVVSPARVPARDALGRTLWVTRVRPKIDRVACPWLIRRFVDRDAVFLFVAPSEVLEAAERFGATPFDLEDIFWSHRGNACTFDTMIEEFGLRSEALSRLTLIVRAADTAHLELAPQAAGLLAASLGLSRMYRDDLAQLDASMGLYDAFYRWCRDATKEEHNWTPGERA
jgi:rhodanese-related sulfurtransferase